MAGFERRERMTSEDATNAYKPDRVSPPGETPLELLDARRMPRPSSLVGRRCRERPSPRSSRVKARMTPDIALELERVLAIRASFWRNLERNYRESLAR